MKNDKYLLIQSRDPFEIAEVENDYQLAIELAGAGNEVMLFLVQNGVMPARTGSRETGLHRVINQGMTVLGDDFSLRERGINSLIDGVRPASLEVVIDRLAEGHKALWL